MPRKHPDGIAARSERAVILKNELNAILDLVVHARKSLENELNNEFAQKQMSIDKAFVSRLKDLASCYGQLTDARIRLDKHEKQMEAEMTPAEELAAVRSFVRALPNTECYEFIQDEWKHYKNRIAKTGRPGAENLPE